MTGVTFSLFMGYKMDASKFREVFRFAFVLVSLNAVVLPLALVFVESADAFGDFVQVFGGPEYEPSTETGYLSQFSPHFLPVGNRVNNDGTAVGWENKFDAGTNLGERGVLWSGTGGVVRELNGLGTGNNDVTESRAYALNENAIAVGFARKYLSGTSLGRRAVRWSSDGNAIELANLGTDNDGWPCRTTPSKQA